MRISENTGIIAMQTGCFNGLILLDKFLMKHLAVSQWHSSALKENSKSLDSIQLYNVSAQVGFKDLFYGNRYAQFI